MLYQREIFSSSFFKLRIIKYIKKTSNILLWFHFLFNFVILAKIWNFSPRYRITLYRISISFKFPILNINLIPILNLLEQLLTLDHNEESLHLFCSILDLCDPETTSRNEKNSLYKKKTKKKSITKKKSKKDT